MNETECANLIESVKWTEPGSLVSLAILEFINVLVIVGNCLVIAAVFCSNKLRSVTNFFIVNLAVADLLVGLAVLPFSATWEVFKVWIFGDVWCRIWLAVDVWMCTASILNLCAISLDRYVAVTRPVTYPSIMSTKKAKSLIAGIWVLSFVICFPPLVGWKDQKPEVYATYTRGNHTLYYATTVASSSMTTSLTSSDILANPSESSEILTTKMTSNSLMSSSSSSSSSAASSSPSLSSKSSVEEIMTSYEVYSSALESDLPFSSPSTLTSPTVLVSASSVDYISPQAPPSPPPPCPWKCELTNDRGYVLYSALGSFYIPMFVMLFFYWRIYRAAVRTTRAINQGFKTTKGSKTGGISGSNASCGKTSGSSTGNKNGSGSRFDENRLTLRMHRGRPSNKQHHYRSQTSVESSSLSVNSNNFDDIGYGTSSSSVYSSKRATSMKINRNRHEKVSITISYPSSENVIPISPPPHSATSQNSSYSGIMSNNIKENRNSRLPSAVTSFSNDGRNSNFKTNLFDIGETTFNLDNSSIDIESGNPAGNHGSISNYLMRGRSRNKMNLANFMGNRKSVDSGSTATSVPTAAMSTTASSPPPLKSKKRSGKRNIKFQVKRFRMETKAAKTLAIIVGGFIFCWLPFFTMYLVRAFCQQCIQPLLFSVLFWLGYCNSAINPVIYALFSNEFRIAFKRILFRCVCTRSAYRASENFQLIAARTFLAPVHFHKTVSGCTVDPDADEFS